MLGMTKRLCHPRINLTWKRKRKESRKGLMYLILIQYWLQDPCSNTRQHSIRAIYNSKWIWSVQNVLFRMEASNQCNSRTILQKKATESVKQHFSVLCWATIAPNETMVLALDFHAAKIPGKKINTSTETTGTWSSWGLKVCVGVLFWKGGSKITTLEQCKNLRT